MAYLAICLKYSFRVVYAFLYVVNALRSSLTSAPELCKNALGHIEEIWG